MPSSNFLEQTTLAVEHSENLKREWINQIISYKGQA